MSPITSPTYTSKSTAVVGIFDDGVDLEGCAMILDVLPLEFDGCGRVVGIDGLDDVLEVVFFFTAGDVLAVDGSCLQQQALAHMEHLKGLADLFGIAQEGSADVRSSRLLRRGGIV